MPSHLKKAGISRCPASQQFQELISVEVAAETLDVCPHTIRTWIKEGKVPAKRYGRQYRILKSDFLKLMDSGIS